MLETIREYALERLIERGQDQGVRGQYAAYYLTLVETANQYLTGSKPSTTTSAWRWTGIRSVARRTWRCV
jgi:hypothetical protein